MAIMTTGTVLQVATTADRIHALPKDEQYPKAVVWMLWRDWKPTYVTFHFEDGSSVTFKKLYELA